MTEQSDMFSIDAMTHGQKLVRQRWWKLQLINPEVNWHVGIDGGNDLECAMTGGDIFVSLFTFNFLLLKLNHLVGIINPRFGNK